MKALKILGAVFGLLVVGVVVTLAVGIPGGFITGMIEDRVEKETGLQLDINGGATIKLWPLTVVTLSDVALFDPKDKAISERFRAESIRAEVSLRSLLAGNPRVRQINIVRPVVNLAMARERTRQLTTTPRSTASLDDVPLAIDRVVVSDATIVFKDPRHRVENRIEKLNVKALASPGRKLDVTADARSGDQAFKVEAKVTIPNGPVDNMTLPIDFKAEAPGLLPQALSGNGEVKFSGTTVSINSLTGALGNARFSGYASIEATIKPLVKVNLDFKQLDIDAPSAVASKPVGDGWSTEPIKLDGLNYVDADFQISAAALNIGALQIAPAKIEGSLSSGIVRMTLSELGLYDGKAAAGLALDASIPSPIFALRAELRGVRALPLLSNAADFTSLDGRMNVQLDVRSTGRNQREMIANLSGTTNADFLDGEIRGINVAQMVRNLTSSTLSGWQENETLKTDLTELHASFRIEKGKAETSDLRLAGPLVRVTGTGTTDLNTKTLYFRIEPKLVMTTQGQGSTGAEPIGLGVPVVMEGPWSAPKMYPDMAGILDNPDAAFGKLRELGQGLFGPNFLGGGTGSGQAGQPGQGNKVIESIGSIIQGFVGGSGSDQSKNGTTAPQAAPQGAQPQGAQPAQPQGQAPQAAPSQRPSQDPQNQIDSVIRQLFGR
jgi:AsmA protein